MTNLKATKRALLASIMSIILCCSMLLGTTFAWFTDTAESVGNKIIAGNLDVVLEMWDGTEYVNIGDSKSPIFGADSSLIAQNDNSNTIWEPGKTQVAYLKIRNAGNLDLKYSVAITVSDVEKNLHEVMQYSITPDAKADEVTAWDATNAKQVKQGIQYDTEHVTLKAGAEYYFALSLHMDEDAGNSYKKGTLTFDLTVLASQVNTESDSFGINYDESSIYPVKELPETADGSVTINNVSELYYFAQQVNAGNTYAGKTVKLNADIDLSGINWTPIGTNADDAKKFKGTFDGQNHTISNLTITQEAGYHAAGFFGALNGTAKNFIIDGATITSISSGTATDNGTAVVAGSLYTVGYVDNVTVKNATVNGNRYVGGITGYTYGSVTNCTVENVTLIATPDNLTGTYDNGDKVGAIAGYYSSESTYAVKNNTVTNVKISAYRDAGGIVGCANGADTVTDNTVTNLEITVDQVTRFYEQKDANVNAIVGRSTSGTLGTTNNSTNVKIVEYESVSEGLYKDKRSTRPSYYVSSAAGLASFAEWRNTNTVGEGSPIGAYCTLLNDIDMTGVEYTAFNGQFTQFDGNNHTIKNLNSQQGISGKGGLVSYLGGGIIQNLTLENATVTGCQVGLFAGQSEGGKIENCYVTGNNTVIWSQNVTSDYVETWNGIGAIVGYNSSGTFNAEIVSGATVTLNATGMTSSGTKVDNLTGYGSANSGIVTNNGTVTVATSAADDESLIAAIKGGATHITLSEGTYTIDNATNSTLTITGTKDTVIAIENESTSEGCDYGFRGSNVTFEGVTITTNGNTYNGYAGLTATYNNCTINKTYTLYGDSVFNNCTFNVSGNAYNIWTWGADNVEFNNCTFNCDGKSILVYNQTCTVTLNDCEINDNGDGTVSGKAAIETGTDGASQATYNIIVNRTKVNGFDKTEQNTIIYTGTDVGTNVWGNKNLIDTAYLNVTIDGKVEY